MARLSDREVDQLIADRGSDDAPRMSYTQLAQKWGISKSSVRDILIGRRRGQIGPSVEKPESKKSKRPKVRVNLRIGLHARAKLHRLGGGAWLERVIEEATV
ncbi:MAG TPA: hypothetical protein PLH47_05600 [Ottowia sp.]|nr:hypothetical protein [Ottowia sp.]